MTATDKHLDAALAHTVSEITRTDTKAGLILTLDGLLVAALSFLGTDIEGVALVLAVVAMVTVVASVLLAVTVIRPRLTGRGLADKGSFVYWAEATTEEITESLITDRRLTRVQVLSRIAIRKMRFLSHASTTSMVGVVAVAAAILTR